MDSASRLEFVSQSNLAQTIPGKNYWIGAFGFVILLVFTWLPNSYSLMVGWPYVLIWQGSFLLLGGCTFSLCRKFCIPFTRIGYGLDTAIFLVLFSALLSTLTAPFKAIALWNFLLVANYTVVLYFLVNWLRNGKTTRNFLWTAVSFAGTTTSIISLAMWRPNADMWLSENFYAAIRNSQPLGHHNFVGGYALLVFPLVLGLSLSQKSWRKWGLSTASFIIATTLYVSGSRGALVGVLVLGIVSIILGITLSRKDNRRRWIISGICFCLIMSLALLSNPRIRALFSIDHAVEEGSISVVSVSDGPTKDRIFMLKSAQNILKTHPVLGVGPGNLSRVYNNYRPIEAGSGLNLVQQLHNTPAQIAAELGLLGLSAYVVLVLTVCRLGFIIYKNTTEPHDRILLCSVAASWFGYGVSSLSDYQLENIGIAITLTSTTALLVNLADTTRQNASYLNLSSQKRRVASMTLLLFLCVNVQLWTRVDTGLYLSNVAVRDAQSLNLVSADEKWSKAGQLVPWDPTYPALAADTILELMSGAQSDGDLQELRTLAIERLRKAVRAAPADPWFNQNLATLLIENGDETAAESYAKEAVRLSPRDTSNYTYYTLGMSLLQQGKESEAVESFVLEALASPIFLTADNWNRLPLLEIRAEVVRKTLKAYRQVLSETNKLSSQYVWLQEQWAMLSWWHGYPVSEQERKGVRSLVQAMLISNEDPQGALQLIDEHLSSGAIRGNDIVLIQARLSPERYFSELIKRLDGTTAEKLSLEESLKNKGTMQAWLGAVISPAKTQTRYALVFAYRNLAANVIRKIVYPGNIHNSVLLASGSLFKGAPREYPQLDRHMAQVRLVQLAID